ncbi:hypothetical protein MLD38_028821 [Melastoma candidum]|uniref:Uncharacterized protein n=1 Tax=Melastoma candidum TaxID=119954 RepID=A0ACB9N3Y6_9MYRT|nr:hypothetical protein MLD38_028821 [Melastoma candidum]
MTLNGKLLKANDKGTRRDIQRELRNLSKEERKRQQLAVADVFKGADVLLTTLTGASSRKLENTSFDLVLIDEAAQALEIACWIAIPKVTSMLTVQYRMHERIMCWSSEELYDNKIEAHPSVAGHRLCDREGVKKSTSAESTLLLIDTAGCETEEKKDEEESTFIQ